MIARQNKTEAATEGNAAAGGGASTSKAKASTSSAGQDDVNKQPEYPLGWFTWVWDDLVDMDPFWPHALLAVSELIVGTVVMLFLQSTSGGPFLGGHALTYTHTLPLSLSGNLYSRYFRSLCCNPMGRTTWYFSHNLVAPQIAACMEGPPCLGLVCLCFHQTHCASCILSKFCGFGKERCFALLRAILSHTKRTLLCCRCFYLSAATSMFLYSCWYSSSLPMMWDRPTPGITNSKSFMRNVDELHIEPYLHPYDWLMPLQALGGSCPCPEPFRSNFHLGLLMFQIVTVWGMSFLYPMDWDMWYQEWPLPTVYSCLFTHVVAQLVAVLENSLPRPVAPLKEHEE